MGSSSSIERIRCVSDKSLERAVLSFLQIPEVLVENDNGVDVLEGLGKLLPRTTLSIMPIGCLTKLDVSPSLANVEGGQATPHHSLQPKSAGNCTFTSHHPLNGGRLGALGFPYCLNGVLIATLIKKRVPVNFLAIDLGLVVDRWLDLQEVMATTTKCCLGPSLGLPLDLGNSVGLKSWEGADEDEDDTITKVPPITKDRQSKL
eukprot:Gb_36485 [translate_table: standard]